jgi:hypothetical protein
MNDILALLGGRWLEVFIDAQSWRYQGLFSIERFFAKYDVTKEESWRLILYHPEEESSHVPNPYVLPFTGEAPSR